MRIARGITRTVLVGKRYAVKFPSLRAYDNGVSGVVWSIVRGISANMSEREWSGQPGLCPVRWSLFGIINVYPTATPPPSDDIDYESISPWLPASDKKPHNVGVLNGELVWIDYDMNWNDCSPCNRRLHEEL